MGNASSMLAEIWISGVKSIRREIFPATISNQGYFIPNADKAIMSVNCFPLCRLRTAWPLAVLPRKDPNTYLWLLFVASYSSSFKFQIFDAFEKIAGLNVLTACKAIANAWIYIFVSTRRYAYCFTAFGILMALFQARHDQIIVDGGRVLEKSFVPSEAISDISERSLPT